MKDNKKDTVKRHNKLLMELFLYLVIIILGIVIVPKFLLQRIIVDGSSMESTLHTDESVLIEKVSVRMKALKRFDIVVFYPYGPKVDKYYIKRIIGLPGERVRISDGRIYINGALLEEHYGKEELISYAGTASEEIVLGEDEYFVLGDNREVSQDSRYTSVGNVNRKNITGRVLLRIWPLSVLGTVN